MLLLVGLACLLMMPWQSGQAQPAGAASDEPMAPDFALKTMKGKTFRLSDHRGKVVVINFWATWCPPCRSEIPDFIELQNELGDNGLLFVGVSLDRGGFEVVRPFAEQMGINYPLVVDDGTVTNKYGNVPGLPTTFVVGPKGRVRGYAPGAIRGRRLRPTLKKLLAEVPDGKQSKASR